MTSHPGGNFFFNWKRVKEREGKFQIVYACRRSGKKKKKRHVIRLSPIFSSLEIFLFAFFYKTKHANVRLDSVNAHPLPLEKPETILEKFFFFYFFNIAILFPPSFIFLSMMMMIFYEHWKVWGEGGKWGEGFDELISNWVITTTTTTFEATDNFTTVKNFYTSVFVLGLC